MSNFDFDNFSVTGLHRSVGANVARLRKAKGMSQLDLELNIGLKSSGLVSVAEINRNNRHFNIEHLYKIVQVLEVDICEFFKSVESVQEPSIENHGTSIENNPHI